MCSAVVPLSFDLSIAFREVVLDSPFPLSADFVTAATGAFSLFWCSMLSSMGIISPSFPSLLLLSLFLLNTDSFGNLIVFVVEFLVPVGFNFVTVLRFSVFDIEEVLLELFKSSLLLLNLSLLSLLFTPPLPSLTSPLSPLLLPPPFSPTLSVATDPKSLNDIRAVVGFRIVDVPQTLGCDVINHGGLGRVVVDVVSDSIDSVYSFYDIDRMMTMRQSHILHTWNGVEWNEIIRK